MSKAAADSVMRGLGEALDYTGGVTAGARVHEIEVPATSAIRRHDPAPEEFAVPAFAEAARRGELPALLARYLGTGPWANPGLRDGLTLAPRWWTGPVRARLDALVPVHGPGLEYDADPVLWERGIARFAAGLTQPDRLPPLVLEWKGGVLTVRDGSHRLAAARLRGWVWLWVIAWSNSARDHASLAGHDALLPERGEAGR